MYFSINLKKILVIVAAIAFLTAAVHFSAVTRMLEKYFIMPQKIENTKGSKNYNVIPGASEKLFDAVEAQRLYEVCGHTEPLNLGSISNVSIKDLQEKFPVKEGWSIKEKEDCLILTQTLNTLCGECERKRHLGSFGEYVAVVKGPPGVNGGYLEVTNIKIKDLPPQWQELIKKGKLNFPSAEKLLEALDSLDEYQN